MDVANEAREATVSGINIEADDGGYRVSYDDTDPLSFVWQTEAQMRDFIAKVQALLPADPGIPILRLKDPSPT